MSSTHFGKDAGKRPSAKAQARERSEGCSFCWFVLAVYPALRGMTARDTETYREHLKKAHGLTDNIRQ